MDKVQKHNSFDTNTPSPESYKNGKVFYSPIMPRTDIKGYKVTYLVHSVENVDKNPLFEIHHYTVYPRCWHSYFIARNTK
jgi:hypothetical protein